MRKDLPTQSERTNMKEIIEMNNKRETNKTTNAGRTTSNKREIKEGETNEATKQQTQDASTSKTQCFLSFSLKQTNSGQSNAKQTPNKRRRNRQNIQVASTRRKHHNERPILSFSFPNEAWHVVWNKHSPRGKFLSLGRELWGWEVRKTNQIAPPGMDGALYWQKIRTHGFDWLS